MLTKRQKQALDFIKSYSQKRGYAPSLEEIKRHLGLSSVSTAHHHVKALEDLGYLTKEENQPRAIGIMEKEFMVSIPMLGKIVAGEPIEGIEVKEKIAVPKSSLPRSQSQLFALTVTGDSMVEDNIHDGDVVIVKQQNTADDGDRVVALINNSEVTLKKFFREGKQIRLQPANKTMDPIFVDSENIQVQGKVINVVRDLPGVSTLESIKPAITKFVQLKQHISNEVGTDARIKEADKELENKFKEKLIVNSDLKRSLVSFQANKKEPRYRWYKFKEGYSAALVEYCYKKVGLEKGPLIDPFAGSGTSLFVASSKGIDSTGIELLPIGAEILEVRKLSTSIDPQSIRPIIIEWLEKKPWLKKGTSIPFPHIKITQGAFPPETERALGRYLFELKKVKNKNVARILRFAAICILENVSYTRKDGQYLRWDYRSDRKQGAKKFDKGKILSFDEAIQNKLREMHADLGPGDTLFDSKKANTKKGKIDIQIGSCLEILPKLRSGSFSGLMTSPPYCNRYDYTRTYALELALLGSGEQEIRQLRQDMMSCTVENRDKPQLTKLFDQALFRRASIAFDNQKLLQLILNYLEEKKAAKELNNPGIVRMVKNYFFEMGLIIFESARVLKKGAPLIMVNDNVRYAGANISVDLILSDLASKAGFDVEKIWVLPVGKGNSSQQMGTHGREELRKCVYVWRKL